MAGRWGRAADALAWVGMASLVIMFLHQFVHLKLRRVETEVAVVLPLSILLPLVVYALAGRVPVLAVLYLGRRREPKVPALVIRP